MVKLRRFFQIFSDSFTVSQKQAFVGVAIFLIGFLVYIPSFHNEMFWDDDDFILQNAYVHDLHNFPKYFSENVIAGRGLLSNYWRPVLLTVFGIEWQLFGSSVVPWHVVNTVTHALNGVFVFYLLERIFKKRLVSVVAALVFLVHPVQVEAVAYVNSFGDSLSVVFILSGLLCFERGIHHRGLKRWLFISAATVGYTLALLSKETAIIMPALALLIIFFAYPRELFRTRIFHGIRFTWILWLFGGIYFLLRATVANFKNSFNLYDQANVFSEHFYVRLFTFCKSLLTYFSLLVWPNHLHMERSLLPEVSFFSLPVWTGMAVVIVLGYFVYYFWKRIPELSFGILWFFIGFAPTSNILIPINGLLYEHWLYVPIIGVGIVLGYGVWYVHNRYRLYQITLFVVLCVILSALSLRAMRRMQEWNNPITFYTQTLQYAPDSYRILNNLGMAYADRGYPHDALVYYNRAITLDNTNPVSIYNRGNAYLAVGDVQKAIADYTQAIVLDNRFSFAYTKLASVYFAVKDTQSALIVLQKYLEVFPNDQAVRDIVLSLQKNP